MVYRRNALCATQVLSAAGAAWFIGGEEADVSRLLEAWRPNSTNSTTLQWVHFPGDTWQIDHWDSVPAGGDPSSAYMGVLHAQVEPLPAATGALLMDKNHEAPHPLTNLIGGPQHCSPQGNAHLIRSNLVTQDACT